MNIRTASATRTKAAAAAVLITLSGGALTGCGGGNQFQGAYANPGNGWVLIINDERVALVGLASGAEPGAGCEDIVHGVTPEIDSLNPKFWKVEASGLLDLDRNAVIWDDETVEDDPSPVKMQDDSLIIQHMEHWIYVESEDSHEFLPFNSQEVKDHCAKVMAD